MSLAEADLPSDPAAPRPAKGELHRRAEQQNAAFQQAIAQLAKYAAGQADADAVIPDACDSVKSTQ